MEMIGRAVYICCYEAVKLAQLPDFEARRGIMGENVDTTLQVKVIAASAAGTW
jgi:hypothetical protein